MAVLQKFMRVAGNPGHYVDHYRKKWKNQYLAHRDLSYFESLKNKYKGRRGFVIGNGPSLKLEDLDKLKNEICIASNKIYMCYDQVDWRPTLYTISDHLLWPKLAAEVHKHEKRVIIISDLERLSSCRAKMHVVKHLGGAIRELRPHEEGPLFSSDTTKGIYTGYTVTFDNIQWAVHMGLNPIYIIGCDHYYNDEPDVDPDTPIVVGEKLNHFMPGYRYAGEIVNNAAIKEMTQAYQVAREYGEKNGIEIYNATRGGHLEVFPRVSFDDLF